MFCGDSLSRRRAQNRMLGTACTLHRIDPAHHMARFYAMHVELDLFGSIVLVKEWGRIGARGRIVSELHPTEALAVVALQRQADRKRRRGYQPATVAEARKLAPEQGRADSATPAPKAEKPAPRQMRAVRSDDLTEPPKADFLPIPCSLFDAPQAVENLPGRSSPRHFQCATAAQDGSKAPLAAGAEPRRATRSPFFAGEHGEHGEHPPFDAAEHRGIYSVSQ